ncbi:MAG: hydrolase [Desulfuromonadales bacterium]|nr:hydrolase [Desulfuromonadales bacterium]
MSEIKTKFILDADRSVLVVVDVQEKLCKAMDEKVLEHLTNNIDILIQAAVELNIPVIFTEQYPKGLGETLEKFKKYLDEKPVEKTSFSCCGESCFPDKLRKTGRSQAIITGMEAHVCVLQTVLDLLDNGYKVHMVKDAVMSRKKENWRVGVDIARDAGAVVTSAETVLFQLLKRAGGEAFKKLSKLIR